MNIHCVYGVLVHRLWFSNIV